MKRMLPFITVMLLVITAVAATPSEAFAACKYCSAQTHACNAVWGLGEPEYDESALDACEGQAGSHLITVHIFFLLEEYQEVCDEDPDDDRCAACGNQSACHDNFWEGGCHEECSASFAALRLELSTAIAQADAAELERILARENFEFDSRSATIALRSSCELSEAAVYKLTGAMIHAAKRQWVVRLASNKASG